MEILVSVKTVWYSEIAFTLGKGDTAVKCVIRGKEFQFYNNIRKDGLYRLSFNALAKEVFGLSFENWHRAGYWTDNYRPHILFDNGKAVANVSVNVMDTTWRGEARRYIQLGTVMTDPAYRKLGLSDYLMNRVLEDYMDKCDAMYLFANDSVVNFYPRYGFVKAMEYQASLLVQPWTVPIRKLDMEHKADVALLHRAYKKNNPFAELPVLDNFGLLMFYCGSFMKDCIYYLPGSDVVVIAEKNKNTVTIFDIYGGAGCDLKEILGAVAGNSKEVKMGFALKNAPESMMPVRIEARIEEDETLFVLAGKENLFEGHKIMFPLLSHT